jgi:hypothetical protein
VEEKGMLVTYWHTGQGGQLARFSHQQHQQRPERAVKGRQHGHCKPCSCSNCHHTHFDTITSCALGPPCCCRRVRLLTRQLVC